MNWRKIIKSPDRTHYTKDGKVWNGKTHKMPNNGKLMSGNPHNNDSEELFHEEDLKKKLSGKQGKLDRDKNGKIDGDDFAIMRREKVAKEVKTFEKDKNEAASVASLSDLKTQLKDAPKYIKTALNEIERYLQGE
tara:strand:+ start:26 stop:430 length:405 start_codon:yes stop_codon:yes gene_type:complete